MTIDEARELLEYGSWANAQVYETAKELTQEQLEAAVAGSFPSIQGTLAHIIWVEWLWLRRWQGESPTSLPDWVRKPNLGELGVQLGIVESERASHLAALIDADLDRDVAYRGTDGRAFSLPLGQQVRHVVNHSTYHRGQLAAQLRQMGRTPPNTDYARYLREGRQARHKT